MGPRRFHDGQDRTPAVAGDQHDSGNDRSQSGTDGGQGGWVRFRRTGVAGARDQPGAHTDQAMSMLHRKRNNRRATPRKRRFNLRMPTLNWRRIGLSATGFAVIAMALAALGWLLDQPIQRVVVTGRLQRVSAMDVEKVVRAHLGGVGLVTVKLGDISRGVAALPWVARAAVQRSWP